MSVRGRPQACDRARQLASLGLDGELSELERALLSAHLGECEGCRRFEADVSVLTAELRASPFEQVSRPIDLPSRRRVSPRLAQVGAAAAAAVAAGVIGGVIGVLGGKGGGESRSNLPSLQRTTLLAFQEARGSPVRNVARSVSHAPGRGLRFERIVEDV